MDQVDLAIRAGRVVGVLGESGSGKSQLFRSITGLSPGTVTGKVQLDGTELTALSQAELAKVRGRKVGYIFQDPMTSLNPYLKISTQLIETGKHHLGLSTQDAKDRALELLGRVKLPDPERVLVSYPHELSGGMRQRAAIAMALMAEPSLLIADEPTTALDATVQLEILYLLRSLCDDFGVTIVLISHDIGVVPAVCDDVAVMYKGRVVETASAATLIGSPQNPYTKHLIDSTPHIDLPKGQRIAGKQGGRQMAGGVQTPALFAGPGNANSSDGPAQKAIEIGIKQPGDPTSASSASGLRVENLKVEYRIGGSLFGSKSSVQAVKGVSFAVQRGEVLGIVGESGCGKSSLARALVGLAPVANGDIYWDGTRISNLSEPDFRKHRRDIQMVFQDPYAALNPRMRVLDLVAEPLRTAYPGLSAAEIKERVAEVLELVDLDAGMLTRYRHELSGGQAQRIGIARAVVTRPGLLICDEAVSALDVSVQATVLNLLLDLREQLNLAIVFISHDLGVVKYISDRIAVLYFGQIVEAGYCPEILDNPAHSYTQVLRASCLSHKGGRLKPASFKAPAGTHMQTPIDVRP